MINYIHRLFGSAFNESITKKWNSEMRRRIILLRVISSLGIVFLLFFAALNYMENNTQLSLFNLVAALLLIVNLFAFAGGKRQSFNIYFGILIISLLYIYSYITGGTNKTAFVWYFTYPLIANYLLGSKKGGITSAIMVIPVLGLVALDSGSPFFADYHPQFTIRFAAAYLLISIFSYLFEHARETNRKELDSTNKSLEELVSSRTNELKVANQVLRNDIRERKTIEKRLETSQNRYKMLFEKANDGILIVDSHMKIIQCNQKMKIMLGVSKDEIINTKVDTFHPKKEFPQIEKQINKMLNGEIEISKNVPVKKRSGTIFYADISSSTIELDNETCTMGLFRDVSKLLEAEKEKSRLEGRLLQSQKMEAIGELAGGIAHDFNNILSGIIGYAQLAQINIENSEKAIKNIDEILLGSNRAAELVQQILTFSRRTEYQKSSFRLSTVVDEALKLLRSSIPSTIEIVKKLNAESFVYADPIKIHQVVMNLSTNGYHAMRETGGTLTISLTNATISKPKYLWNKKIIPGKYIKLEVSDTGIGMNQHEQEKAFEPYFTTKEIGHGTGLGLALVHAIVDEHDSFLEISSKPGKGTNFFIYFPVVKQAVTDNANVNVNTQIRGHETIMLVDDEEQIRESCHAFLESQGYIVNSFSNGVEALNNYKTDPTKFDLILTDLTMPKLSGDKLAKEILKLQPETPIILTTGFSERLTESQAMEIGIMKFVKKPISNYDLTVLIRKLLNQK